MNHLKSSTTKLKQNKRQKNSNHLGRAHTNALSSAAKQILQFPLSTLVVCIIIAVTLLITATLLVMLKTFHQVSAYAENNHQATLYLKPDLSENQITNWMETLKSDPTIQKMTYISKEQALKELSEQLEYQEILENTSENPLPAVILLKLRPDDKAKVQNLIDSLKTNQHVLSVNLDFEWLKRLSALIHLLHRLSSSIIFLLITGVLFIINHAIQTATQRNQQEIYLLQLIGAPSHFIRRPFLYIGSLLGMISGLMAILFFYCLYLFIQQPLIELLDSYQFNSNLTVLNLKIFVSILLLSTTLGLFGAWLAFYRYLQKIC
jgi:cell division transport system permease protein